MYGVAAILVDIGLYGLDGGTVSVLDVGELLESAVGVVSDFSEPVSRGDADVEWVVVPVSSWEIGVRELLHSCSCYSPREQVSDEQDDECCEHDY